MEQGQVDVSAAGEIAEAATRRVWAHPTDLIEAMSIEDMRLRARWYHDAPWYHPAEVRDGRVLNRYVRGYCFPDGMTFEIIARRDWEAHCCAPNTDLFR